MRRLIGLAVALIAGGAAYAAPLTPTILGHDINFGAYNAATDGIPALVEYSTNGLAPDTLTYTRSPDNGEATGYWPVWPSPAAIPVFDLAGLFGGDVAMNVQFDGQDAPYVGAPATLDVSLTGRGANTAGADFEIYGSIPGVGSGLLWAIELGNVSLYGYSDFDAYVLEGAGTIVGGLVALQNNLIGQPGVIRGNLDFVDAPPGWIPPLYNPLGPAFPNLRVRAGYSGETGRGVAVPEPTTACLVLAGLALALRRR